LLDKFNSHCLQLEYQSLKEVETNPKKPNWCDDPNQVVCLLESERWHMAALGTDLVSSPALQENM
jgi:hypothetical protein